MGPRTLSVISLFALSLSAAAFQRTIPALTRFPEPTKQTVDGATAWCVGAESNVRVCDFETDGIGSPRHSGDLVLYVDRKPALLAEGRWGVYRGMIQLLMADLDGDGSQELIVVDHIATSNGMAMTVDRISIVSDYRRDDRSWISFTVDEYKKGPGTFVRREGRSGLAIFSTEWERYQTLDPQRGYGTYLVGRWFRYVKGRLVPEPGILVRRLLDGFDAERSKDSEDQPYSFFVNGKGRAMEGDPALVSGSSLGTVRGTIERVTPNGDGGADFTLRIDDGRRIDATFGYPTGDKPDEHIDHIALTSMNRVLPEGILPSSVIGDVLGRRVRLERYQDGKGQQKVMWIE